MQFAKRLSAFITRASSINPLLLALGYIVTYVGMEFLIQNPIRLYIYNVFLALSGIYFAWFLGGRRTMIYVAFFNVFIVFIFSRMLWDHNLVISSEVFLARTFIAIYLLCIACICIIMRRDSPADKRSQLQLQTVAEERQRREDLEFVVASRKLKQDLLAQANLVKDELQLLEGAWRSNIHDIINELPDVKEKEIYDRILLPFQQNIIAHLRDLEQRLTFDVRPTPLSELYAFLLESLQREKIVPSSTNGLEIIGTSWRDSHTLCDVDINKVMDILRNVLRNSQTAMDLKRIGLLKARQKLTFTPRIRLGFELDDDSASLTVFDNAGGVPDAIREKLYKEPVPSNKSKGERFGQGTMFVKFFSDRMGIAITVEPTEVLEDPGIAISLRFPLIPPAENFGDSRAHNEHA